MQTDLYNENHLGINVQAICWQINEFIILKYGNHLIYFQLSKLYINLFKLFPLKFICDYWIDQSVMILVLNNAIVKKFVCHSQESL